MYINKMMLLIFIYFVVLEYIVNSSVINIYNYKSLNSKKYIQYIDTDICKLYQYLVLKEVSDIYFPYEKQLIGRIDHMIQTKENES